MSDATALGGIFSAQAISFGVRPASPQLTNTVKQLLCRHKEI